jgi:hypothetical protein
MTESKVPHPEIVSREEWLAARKAHLGACLRGPDP